MDVTEDFLGETNMILILTGIVLFVVGALMAIKPYTYWALGHITKPDAEPPGDLYLKVIRIMGLVVLLLSVLVTGIRVWPLLSGQEVKVSSGQNWEMAFTEDESMAEIVLLPECSNAAAYEAVCDGETVYFLGWERRDGVNTGAAGLYKMTAEGDFAEAELLTSLDETAGRYEKLKYEEGVLTWLQQPLDDAGDSKMIGTAVYRLDLEAGPKEPELVCMLTQNLHTYEYHQGNVFLLDGNAEGAVLWKWDGTESEKLVKQTRNGGYDPHAADGWIGAVNKKQDTVIRVDLESGKEMELKTSLKPQGVWTGRDYTLLACAGGRAAVVVHREKKAQQYVLKDIGETGLMDMAGDWICQLDGSVLTAYNLKTMTFCEMDIPKGRITGLAVTGAGTAVLYDSEKNRVYFSEFSD